MVRESCYAAPAFGRPRFPPKAIAVELQRGISKTVDIGEELGQRAVWCSLLIELQSYRQRLPREATELRKRRPAGRVLFPMPCWVRASILRSASPACAGSGPWRRAGTPLTPPPTRASAVLSASGVA